MKKWGKFLNFTSILGGALVLVMLAIITADVVMRYAFNRPIPGATEWCALIMAWVAYLAIGYTLFVGGHMQMTAFYDKYSKKHQCIANIIYCALGAFLFGILTVASFNAAWTSFVSRELMASARVVYYWIGKAAVPVGSAIFTITAIGMITQNVKEFIRLGKDSGEVRN